MVRTGESGIAQLVRLAQSHYPKLDEARVASTAAIEEISMADVMEPVRSMALELVLGITRLIRAMVPLQQNLGLLVRRWARGEPGPDAYRSELLVLADGLGCLAPLFAGTVCRADGYTAEALKSEGEIGRDLWQQNLRASVLKPTRRGDTARRFSNADVLKLADAAKGSKSRKLNAAAARWRVLVAANKRALTG